LSNKKTRLTEKATRIPDTRPIQWEEDISQYLNEVEKLNKEQARSHRFSMLIQNLFGVEPNFIENYTSGIEKYIKTHQKDRILRGEVDNLFGNVVIEFERNIPKNQKEAEEQVRRYVAILWSNESVEKRAPYIGIATDGVRFITYTPVLDDLTSDEIKPDDVNLEILEEIDWRKLKASEIYYWIDRYFLRQEILHPNSETIVSDFGLKSHAFQSTTQKLLRLWKRIKTHSNFAVVYESWEKYLRIVYGSKVAGDELFIRHTYLATLAKLMSWMRLSEKASLPENTEILKMLEGELFKDQGIDNYIEEDFFSWLSRDAAAETGINTVRWLYSLLQNYRLRELSEDVLKSLYQELVDPETRHDLGEFYTPDWLAHRIVKKLLNENSRGSMLDPACGSGTFLYLAIREKREILGDSLKTLNHIVENVYGADIHPLAVIVAKTNFILALGELLKKRKKAITIPIYLADMIKLPEQFMKAHQYHILIDSKTIYVNEVLLKNTSLYDQAIEFAKNFAQQYKNKSISLDLFRNYLNAQNFSYGKDEEIVKSIYTIVETLKKLIDAGRDTIWGFVLKNIYKPLFFKQKFDFIMGNPPWISFRYMEPGYQKFLKQQIVDEYHLLKGHGELITHIEVGALFLVRAADLYLKQDGKIAFVLPRSIFSSDQHDRLRNGHFNFCEDIDNTLSFNELWDCEEVNPLFKVPSCVLIADKVKQSKSKYKEQPPIRGWNISGKLKRKNAALMEAEESLDIKDVEFSLNIRGAHSYWTTEKEVISAEGPSYYKPRFAQGATIVPRSFWFVKVRPSSLGINPDLPPLETADRARKFAKDAYKDVIFKGTVESRFLYATILSTDLLPFGNLDYRMVVLPIIPGENKYRLITLEEAENSGYIHLAQWLKKAENDWSRCRGAKAETMNIYERLDRMRGITRQNPNFMYRVIYNTSGTFLTASVIEIQDVSFKISGQTINSRGYIADCKTYFYDTNEKSEAYFITALLNSPIINKLIKPMQSRGLWGPRDICKTVLELPIPQFDAENSQHRQLAELGQACTDKVKQWIDSGGPGNIRSIGKLRGMVREMLREELKEIDGVVERILK